MGHLERASNLMGARIVESPKPGQVVIDQINLETHWKNILWTLSGVKGRRYDLAALLRASTPFLCRVGCLHFQYSHQGYVERLLEEFDNLDIPEKIRRALTVAMGVMYRRATFVVEYKETLESLEPSEPSEDPW